MYTPQLYDSKKTFSEAWKGLAEKSGKLDLAGGFTSLVGEIPNQINDFREITDRSNFLDYTGQLDSRVNSLWNTQYNSVDDVLQASKFANLNAANYTDESWTAGQVAGHVLGDAAKGAMIGTQFMPGMGTVIGAIGGTVLGAGKAIGQKIHTNNMLMDAKKAEDEASLNKARAILYGSQQAGFRKNLMQEFNRADMGGPLSHGTLWNDNVILVDNGGTHEQNPYGGVIMGFDEEGTPNMVEEGEVIYNDYVFSNRLKVPKAIRHKYKLRELGGPITYADAIKGSKQFKALEEMPNDIIAKRTFEAFIGDMAMSQEELRQKDMMKQRSNRYDWGGFLEALNKYRYSTQRGGISGTYKIDPNMHKSLGFKTIEDLEKSDMYNAFTDYILNNSDDENVQKYLKALDDGTHKDVEKLFDSNTGKLKDNWKELYAGKNGRSGRRYDKKGGIYHFYTPEMAAELMADKDYQDWLNGIETEDVPFEKIEDLPIDMKETIIESPEKLKYKKGLKGSNVSELAPLFGGIGNIATALASKPDYTPIRRYEDYALSTPKATTHPIGDYMEFNPVPFDYLINRYNAKNLNTKRGLRDLSGGNFATTRGSYLASDYDLMNDIGEFGLNAMASNLQQKQATKTFNRGTNQYNSEDAYKTMAIDFDTYGKGLQALMQGAKDRLAVDAGYSQAMSSNISTATQNMYDWGKYKEALGMIINNPFFSDAAKAAMPGYHASKGGLLTVKKIRRK